MEEEGGGEGFAPAELTASAPVRGEKELQKERKRAQKAEAKRLKQEAKRKKKEAKQRLKRERAFSKSGYVPYGS